MARIIVPTASDRLAAESALLESLGIERLKTRLKALYGTEVPPRISRDLLTRAVAYRIQERALGGLSVSTRRALQHAADAVGKRRPMKVAQVRQVGPGTVLLREWAGAPSGRYLRTAYSFRGSAIAHFPKSHASSPVAVGGTAVLWV